MKPVRPIKPTVLGKPTKPIKLIMMRLMKPTLPIKPDAGRGRQKSTFGEKKARFSWPIRGAQLVPGNVPNAPKW